MWSSFARAKAGWSVFLRVYGGGLLVAVGKGGCIFYAIKAMMTAMTESGHVTSGWGEGALGYRGRR